MRKHTPGHPTTIQKIKRDLRRLHKLSLSAQIGLIISFLIIVIAIFGDYLAPSSAVELNFQERLIAPSWEHPFGTDEFGRDLLSRVLIGAKYSLSIAAAVLLISSTTGTLVGLVAGYYGKWLDEVLMRFTDIFFAFPALILAVAIASTLGANAINTIIALSLVYWPLYARLIRSQVLKLRQEEYITAAQAFGANGVHIISRHLLPNILPLYITQACMDMGLLLLATSGLSFLGLGVQPPTPEWGALLIGARQYIRDAWWYTSFPGFALGLSVLGFNLLGDALRESLDPRHGN